MRKYKDEGHIILLMPDGTIVYDPTPDDFAIAREEARDLEWD